MLEQIAEIGGILKRIFQFLFLGQTKIADFTQVTTSQNTWYTALNATSETGKLKLIRAKFNSLGDADEIEIRVTRDGIANDVYSISTSGVPAREGLQDDTSKDSRYISIPFDNDWYSTSLKVEIRHVLAADTSQLDIYIVRKAVS